MLAVVLAAGVAFAALPASAQRAEEPAETTTTIAPPPDIIPEPDQGVAPEDAGDRGGALQTALFVLIVGGTVAIGLLAYRQSRRARAERGF